MGSEFDAGKHMVAERVVGGEKDNIILSVESRGYEVNGRVVRCVLSASLFSIPIMMEGSHCMYGNKARAPFS